MISAGKLIKTGNLIPDVYFMPVENKDGVSIKKLKKKLNRGFSAFPFRYFILEGCSYTIRNIHYYLPFNNSWSQVVKAILKNNSNKKQAV